MALSNFEFVTGKLEKHIHCITISGEGHGNPLQYSCLRIPRTEEPGGSPWGHKESDTTEAT